MAISVDTDNIFDMYNSGGDMQWYIYFGKHFGMFLKYFLQVFFFFLSLVGKMFSIILSHSLIIPNSTSRKFTREVKIYVHTKNCP